MVGMVVVVVVVLPYGTTIPPPCMHSRFLLGEILIRFIPILAKIIISCFRGGTTIDSRVWRHPRVTTRKKNPALLFQKAPPDLVWGHNHFPRGTMVTRTLVRCGRAIPNSSLGFSGAGFLAAYHLGVLRALQQHHCTKKNQRLTGVSAGALVATAVAAGLEAHAGLETVLEIAAATRRAGPLHTLQPYYSLVDVTEEALRRRLCDNNHDNHKWIQDLQDGTTTLRIGLTDRRHVRIWPGRRQPTNSGTHATTTPTPQAVCFVDGYRDVEDVIAACVLSSYIPGVTGPTWGSLDDRNTAIYRAARRLQDMQQAGLVKDGVTGQPLPALPPIPSKMSTREWYWDGGLVNAFPVFDRQTLIVTPIAADFAHNPSINPSLAYRARPQANHTTSIRTFRLPHAKANVHLTAANWRTFQSLLLNPDEANLRNFYAQGYEHACLYLEQQQQQQQQERRRRRK